MKIVIHICCRKCNEKKLLFFLGSERRIPCTKFFQRGNMGAQRMESKAASRNGESSHTRVTGSRICSRTGRPYRPGWKQIDWPADIELKEKLEKQRNKKRIRKIRSFDTYKPLPAVPINVICQAEIARLKLNLKDRTSSTGPKRDILKGYIPVLQDAMKSIRLLRDSNTRKLFYQRTILYLRELKEIIGFPLEFEMNPRKNPQLAHYMKIAADNCSKTKSQLRIFRANSELGRALCIKEKKKKPVSKLSKKNALILNPSNDFRQLDLSDPLLQFFYVTSLWIEKLKNM